MQAASKMFIFICIDYKTEVYLANCKIQIPIFSFSTITILPSACMAIVGFTSSLIKLPIGVMTLPSPKTSYQNTRPVNRCQSKISIS